MQVNGNTLLADWYSDPCLNFTFKASAEAALRVSDSGEMAKEGYTCLNLCKSLATHQGQITVIES